MEKKPAVALIGAGSMGGALLRGWIEEEAIDMPRSAIYDPAVRDDIAALAHIAGIRTNPDITPVFDAVVLAVKPQIAEKVLPPYAVLAENAVMISVMAGKSISSISAMLGGADRIVRTMPNLPAAIGKGATGMYAREAVDNESRDVIATLMRCSGTAIWVRTEEEIDMVTAISGSGPAYYFLLTEALSDAGQALGLEPETAARLARATCEGAGALLDADKRSPENIRKAVTSPGGTTEAALNIFDGDESAMRNLVLKATAAAKKRAGELTG